MKIWKKLAALALGCTFTLSAFTACDGISKLFNKDSGVEDSSSSSSQSSSVEDQDVKTTEEYNITGALTVAQTEKGADLQMSITAPEIAEMNEQMAVLVQMLQDVYVVDGFVYYKSGATWASSSTSIWAMMEEEGVDPTEIQAAIAEMFTALEEQGAASSTVSLSYKNECNAILDYIGALSPQMTLMELTDDALALLGTSFEDVKTYIIENEVGDKTVGEVHTQINAYLAENTEYEDIDAAVEVILSNPEIASLIDEVADGMITAESIIEMDLDAEIEKYADVTVDELIAMVVTLMESNGNNDMTTPPANENNGVETVSETSETEEQDSVTLESLVAELETLLTETTLGDIMPNDVWMALAMCNAIEVTKCDIVLTMESTFGKLNSADVGFVFAFEMEIAPNVITEYVLNLDVSIELVNTITAPKGAVYTCYVCKTNNLEDASVTARENGYVLCNACFEQMTWETCEYCWERKADVMEREGEQGKGVFCEACAPLLNNTACAYCDSREPDVGIVLREETGEYMCDQCYKYNVWEMCAHCYENKEDAIFRDDLEEIYCDECYAYYLQETCEECSVKGEDVVYRTDYDGYYCDECYPTLGFDECVICREKKEDTVYREDKGYDICDECYANW